MLRKTFSKVTTVISWLLLIAMIVAILTLVLTKINGGEPQLFGYRLFEIASGSMSPTLEVYDVILARNYVQGDELQIGDILTYRGSGATEGVLVTHRLKYIEEVDGETKLILRGDFNTADDSPISESEVVAVYVCKLKLLGYIFRVMKSDYGMPVLFAMILLFIIMESLDFYKSIQKNNTVSSESGEKTETDDKKGKKEEDNE